MKLHLVGEREIRLELAGGAFEVHSQRSPLSPFHLLAGSLASCTALTVASWAWQVGVEVDDLALSVSWEMAEGRPSRIGSIDVVLHWPGLPAERAQAAERAADACPIHATLARSVEIRRRVENGGL